MPISISSNEISIMLASYIFLLLRYYYDSTMIPELFRFKSEQKIQ